LFGNYCAVSIKEKEIEGDGNRPSPFPLDFDTFGLLSRIRELFLTDKQ